MNELRPVLFVTVDAPIQIYSDWRPLELFDGRIVKVGRTWFTVHIPGDLTDYRFRIEDLEPHRDNSGWHATNKEFRAYNRSTADAWRAINSGGLDLRPGYLRLIHDEDLFAVAAIFRKRAEAGGPQ